MYEPGQYGPGTVPGGIYADEPRPPVYPPPPGRRAGLFGGSSMMTFIFLGVLVLSLLFSLVAVIMLGTAKRSLQTSLNEQSSRITAMEGSLASLQQANQTLQARMAMLEAAAAPAPATTATAAPNNITITWSPLDVSTTLGRDEALLFQAKATNSANSTMTFTWQKQNTSNEWDDIAFTAIGYNEELGLRLYDNSPNGESQLWCRGLTEKAFGTYRCKIQDKLGSVVYTEPVLVSQKAPGEE